MHAQHRPEFDSAAQKELYSFVERNGLVERETIEETVSLDTTHLEEALESLTADAYLEEEDGQFRIAMDIDAEQTHTVGDLEFTIRQARQSDLRGLISVMREVAAEDAYLTAESVVDLLDHEEVVFRHNDIESRMFFVATVDDEVVGWVTLRSPNFEKLSHTAELTMGVVAPYRGHQIGSRLMERGLEWAKTNGYEKVYQSIPATNQQAVTFLEKHRWETEAIRNAHFKIDDTYVAEQQMAVMLSHPILG